MSVSLARNDVITVGATSVNVSPDKSNTPGGRTLISMYNGSAAGQKITISFGVPSVATKGFVLSPGQSVIDSNSEGYKCYQGTINAIADGAGGSLSILER